MDLSQYVNAVLLVVLNAGIVYAVKVANDWLAAHHMTQISAQATTAIQKMVDAKAGAWVLSSAPGFENLILSPNDPWIVKEAYSIGQTMAHEAALAGMTPEKIAALLAGAMGNAQLTQQSAPTPPAAPAAASTGGNNFHTAA